MPHNLYLHSALVKHHAPRRQRRADQGARCTSSTSIRSRRWRLLSSINAALLIVAAAVFYVSGHRRREDLADAHRLIAPLVGTHWASILFAAALLACGLSATVTGTLAGQAVMEGFLRIRSALEARAADPRRSRSGRRSSRSAVRPARFQPVARGKPGGAEPAIAARGRAAHPLHVRRRADAPLARARACRSRSRGRARDSSSCSTSRCSGSSCAATEVTRGSSRTSAGTGATCRARFRRTIHPDIAFDPECRDATLTNADGPRPPAGRQSSTKRHPGHGPLARSLPASRSDDHYWPDPPASRKTRHTTQLRIAPARLRARHRRSADRGVRDRRRAPACSRSRCAAAARADAALHRRRRQAAYRRSAEATERDTDQRRSAAAAARAATRSGRARPAALRPGNIGGCAFPRRGRTRRAAR